MGTELLTGQIVNTNAQFLSEKFAEIGIDVFFQTSVGDNASRLLEVLSIAKQRSNLVVLCGGLGPTDDDLTKQTLAMFLNRKLVFNVEANQKLDDFFATRPTYSRTPNNERQAQLIEGSHAIQNITGLAVGGMVTVDGVTYVVLPGPPSELKPMVNQGLIPLLTTNHNSLYSRVLRFFGIGESQLVTVLDDIIEQQSDPTVAPYAKIGEVTLRISTKAESQEEADFKLDKFESEILSRRTLNNEVLRDLLYGYGEDNSLPKVVFNLLREHSKTITAAESLTGGLFQSSIADFSGASKIFNGGYVTYSLPEKSRMLDIPIDDLEKNGVVSQFTAEQMANQARKLTKSDYAVSLTGVAGPDSLEGHLPGTVFIGLASKDKVYSRKVIIGGRSRSDIRYIATLHAFNLVRQTLLNK